MLTFLTLSSVSGGMAKPAPAAAPQPPAAAGPLRRPVPSSLLHATAAPVAAEVAAAPPFRPPQIASHGIIRHGAAGQSKQ